MMSAGSGKNMKKLQFENKKLNQWNPHDGKCIFFRFSLSFRNTNRRTGATTGTETTRAALTGLFHSSPRLSVATGQSSPPTGQLEVVEPPTPACHQLIAAPVVC